MLRMACSCVCVCVCVCVCGRHAYPWQVFRWIDNEIKHDVTYQMAPAYVNFHEPSAATAR